MSESQKSICSELESESLPSICLECHVDNGRCVAGLLTLKIVDPLLLQKLKMNWTVHKSVAILVSKR